MRRMHIAAMNCVPGVLLNKLLDERVFLGEIDICLSLPF